MESPAISTEPTVPVPVVARQNELAHLRRLLEQTILGRGTLCFITGAAGTGKSTLLTSFIQQAQAAHDPLLTVMGTCDAYTGVGDPYLPFREILLQLTDSEDERLNLSPTGATVKRHIKSLLRITCQILVEHGPDLIGTFVPSAKLLTTVGTSAAKKTGWFQSLEKMVASAREGASFSTEIDQSQIFEQYVNVLKVLAAQVPLVLLIDDLQWSDSASIGLLFRLGRRLGDSPILLIGAYRTEEVVAGRNDERHPLEKVLTEFKRYFGDIWLDLDQAAVDKGRIFIDGFLNSEPNRLDDAFRRALFNQTGGHPLFTIELLRSMQERGDLIQDEEGYWVEGPSLNWAMLPVRVEGALAERIDRLSPDLREYLAVASIEGEQFYAEVVAEIQKTEARALVRMLSDRLQREHRLIASQGVQRLGRQRLSRYAFSHNLFQAYLYSSLDEIERSYLHEDVGLTLESLYGDQAESIAAQLARHFELADMPEKALHYLQHAAEQAAAQFANEEALAYFSRGLTLTSDVEPSTRLDLLLARERVLDVQGERTLQQADLDEASRLVTRIDDPTTASTAENEVALRRGWLALRLGHYETALQLSRQVVEKTETSQSPFDAILSASPQTVLDHQRAAHALRGETLWHQGFYNAAQESIQKALTLARQADDPAGEAQALERLGTIALNQSEHLAAIHHHQQALTIARDIGDHRREWSILNNLGVAAQGMGDHARAAVFYEECLAIVRTIGDRMGESIILCNLGDVYLYLGQYSLAEEHANQGLVIAKEVDDRMGEGFLLGNLSHTYLHRGDDESALAYAERSQQIAQEIGDRMGEGVATYLLGRALLKLGRVVEAEAVLRASLGIWQELEQVQGALEAQAGLATIALYYFEQADNEQSLSQARAYVDDILDALAANPDLVGVQAPLTMETYLVCLRVLETAGAPTLDEWTERAYQLLQKRAQLINDLEWRTTYLDGILAHCEIGRQYARMQGAHDTP